jgi:hypothetical protein
VPPLALAIVISLCRRNHFIPSLSGMRPNTLGAERRGGLRLAKG